MCPRDLAWVAQRERLAAAAQRARDRHLTRRAVWREAGGDPARYTELMRRRLAARPERTDEAIWRDCLHRAVRLIVVHLVVAAGICLWDAWPALATLPYTPRPRSRWSRCWRKAVGEDS
ncbi:hypothetical protein [Actinomadura keratinilytica]|uniref:hypothetical protein n=1 Tax=Actinomadura keratinilytica TaxID=547461 RepID=UPI00362210D3